MKIGTEFYDPSGREIAASLIKMSVLIKFYLFWAAGAGALAVAVRNNGDLNGSSWEFPSAILSRHPESHKTLPHTRQLTVTLSFGLKREYQHPSGCFSPHWLLSNYWSWILEGSARLPGHPLSTETNIWNNYTAVIGKFKKF